MTKIHFYISTLVIGLILAGCSVVDMKKLAKEQKLTVNPNPLELHGDSVKFDISCIVPVKMLKKNKKYVITTTYRSLDQKNTLGVMTFDSKDFPFAATQPPTLTKKFSFLYNKKLNRGDVFIMGQMLNINNSGKKTPEMDIAKGIITTSLLVKDVFPVAYADHGYDSREQLIPNSIDFFFDKRISKLNTKETQTSRGKYFEKFIADKYVTRTVNIIGTHSPEGIETVNEKLSEERAISIEKYYRQMMKKFDYGDKGDSISFIIKGKVKDWSDFKDKLSENKTLPDSSKATIISIVDGEQGTFREKELRLQTLKSYKVIEKEIYPSLRNARTEVYTVKPKKSDAQIFLIAKKIATNSNGKNDTLTEAELLYSATLTPLPDEKEAIYLAATKKLDSFEAHNNLGALYLEKALKENNKTAKATLIENALSQFKIANNKIESGVSLLNISTCKLLLNDIEGAKEAAAMAKTKEANADVTKGVNAVQGVLDIKAGKYDVALSNLAAAGIEPNVLYNKALASLLKKDFTAAKTAFEDAIQADDKNSLAYYCAAVTASRSGDVESVNRYLKRAFALDAKLKNRCVEDLEFITWKENDRFKDALK